MKSDKIVSRSGVRVFAMLQYQWQVKTLTKSNKYLVCSLEICTLAKPFGLGIHSASFHDPRVGFFVVRYFVCQVFSIKILPLPGIHGINILWNRSLNNKFHGLVLILWQNN
jgi:hypothetical protein